MGSFEHSMGTFREKIQILNGLPIFFKSRFCDRCIEI